MRIIRIKNVLFDKTLFYDLAKLDSKYLLIINVKETLKIIKILDNIVFEIIIKEDEDDLSIDRLENESNESQFEDLADSINIIENEKSILSLYWYEEDSSFDLWNYFK